MLPRDIQKTAAEETRSYSGAFALWPLGGSITISVFKPLFRWIITSSSCFVVEIMIKNISKHISAQQGLFFPQK